jgi:chromosome segregation ATPase
MTETAEGENHVGMDERQERNLDDEVDEIVKTVRIALGAINNLGEEVRQYSSLFKKTMESIDSLLPRVNTTLIQPLEQATEDIGKAIKRIEQSIVSLHDRLTGIEDRLNEQDQVNRGVDTYIKEYGEWLPVVKDRLDKQDQLNGDLGKAFFAMNDSIKHLVERVSALENGYRLIIP